MPLKITWRKGVAYLNGTIAGERIRKSTGCRDEEIAESIRTEEEARRQKAKLYGADQEAIFADACLLYIEQGHEQRYLEPLIREFGKRRLMTIKPGELRAFAKRLKPDCKASTLNRHVVGPARAVINHAHDFGLCPPIRVKSFKEAKPETKAITRKDWLDPFRAHACHDRQATLALFIYTTAARIGEAVRLTPGDFDLDAKRARIDETKNGDYRYYYLTHELVRELRLLEPKPVKGDWRMFGYSCGEAVIPAWKTTCKRAGIPYVPPHQAGRHSFATEMIIRQGKDVKTTAELGGWKDPSTLLRKYVHGEDLGNVAEDVFGVAEGTQLTHQSSSRLKVIDTKGK